MEVRLLLALHAHAGPILDAVFLVSHYLGTLPFCAALVLAMALWHRARGERAEAGLWLVLGLTTYLFQEILKTAVARPRPRLWPWLVPVSDPAFPSGHALAAATFYPLLAWSLSRARPSLRSGLWVAAVGLAALIGVGRLYLGVHWPSDVLGGWALGAAQTALGLVWAGRRVRPRSPD